MSSPARPPTTRYSSRCDRPSFSPAIRPSPLLTLDIISSPTSRTRKSPSPLTSSPSPSAIPRPSTSSGSRRAKTTATIRCLMCLGQRSSSLSQSPKSISAEALSAGRCLNGRASSSSSDERVSRSTRWARTILVTARKSVLASYSIDSDPTTYAFFNATRDDAMLLCYNCLDF